KAYFFQGDQYVVYDWTTDRGDPGYPKPIASLVGMPASFGTGIDAAVDGDGPYVNYGYLFKGDQYVRFNWDRGGTNPRVESAVRPIHQNWPGLAELLLAGKAKSQAFEWLRAAQAQVAAYVASLELGTPFPYDRPLIEYALATHFHISPALTASE